jgi:hypothetical protein
MTTPVSSVSVSSEQISTFLQEHGDFKGYDGQNMNHMIFHAAEALNKHRLWHWIRIIDPKYGFALSNDPNIKKIQTEIEEDDHTGTTFGLTMRYLQKIAEQEIKDDGPNELCSICLSSEYSDNKVTLDCGHMFHRECINESWFMMQCNCPNCRRDTVPVPQIARQMGIVDT